jgi:NAD(P)-dependent dehydrogenase (short-subunit alcohol dehydrogenase family)
MSGRTGVQGKRIVITGATNGIGLAGARELARAGAELTIVARDESRGRAAADLVHASATNGTHVDVLLADLASQASVRNLAADLLRRYPRIDVLVNNAGAIYATRQLSPDGIELTWAVNHLAPFLLTSTLLPVLHQSRPARVVNVASAGQAPVNFDDVMLQPRYEMTIAYSQSKLALISFTFELAERLRDRGETEVTATALHPATLMPTKLVLQTLGRTIDALEQGVAATLRLVIDPDLDGVSGVYFDGIEEAAADPQAYEKDARIRLWDLSERLCGLR